MANRPAKLVELDDADQISQDFEYASKLSDGDLRVWLDKLRVHSPSSYQVLAPLFQDSSSIAGLSVEPQTQTTSASGTNVRPLRKKLDPGDGLSSYEVICSLGEGGIGQVYACRDVRLNRIVAVKVFSAVTDEAKVLARLEHNNIVKIHAEEVVADQRLIAMQLVTGMNFDQLLTGLSRIQVQWRGATLISLVDAHPYPYSPQFNPVLLRDRHALNESTFLSAWINLGLQCTRALEYAHSQGVLHLDVKPSNILFSIYGRVYLTDFNVSLQVGNTRAQSMFGGTPQYMAPEQKEIFKSGEVAESDLKQLTPKTDMFALAQVLKEGVALYRQRGKPNWSEEEISFLETVLAHANEPQPEKRPLDMTAFGKHLQSALDFRSLNQALSSVQVPAWFHRHPLLLLTLLGAIPQVFSAILAATYNSYTLTYGVKPQQQDLLHHLNFQITPVIFALGTVAWLLLLLPIYRFLRNENRAVGLVELRKIRRKVLRIPYYGSLLAIIAWVPASILLPGHVHLQGGGLDPASLLHFLTSFMLSSFLAIAYCHLLHSFSVITLLYKRFLLGETEIATRGPRELRALMSLRTVFLTAPILVPLVPALALLVIDFPGAQTDLAARKLTAYQTIVAMMVGLAVLGTFFSQTMAALFRKLDQALTQARFSQPDEISHG